MELIKVGEKTYYIKNPTNIGIYKVSDKDVYLIDTGNDKDAGKKILKIIDGQGWNVKGIITTHSHADHIGGNKVIQDKTDCPVYALGIEKSFTEFPILKPSFFFGGYPFKDLRKKSFLAEKSTVTAINDNLPEGLEYFPLKGHSFDMIGIKTDDDVYFLADSLFSEEVIKKYHLFSTYDVGEYLNTLDYLSTLDGRLFIPSHCKATANISNLIELNRNKVQEISDKLYSLCSKGTTFENILKAIFDDYGLTMNPGQYVLTGSTVHSYLSYLYDNGKLRIEFRDNKMYWKQSGKDKAAILFIHGILGTPNHFKPFLPLIPQDWSVCNLLLKGHGGSVKDFSRASMHEWKQQVSDSLDKLLEENNRVIIVAHSMGTLLAIQEAIEKPIDELFLLNVPLKVHVAFRLLGTSWRVFRGSAKSGDKWSVAAQNAYSIEKDNHIFNYFGWIPRFAELFSEIRKTRKIIRKLKTPSHVYLSLYDETISSKCRELFQNNSCVRVQMLNTSGHFYYSPEDQNLLNEEFNKMILNNQTR
ncbi:MAG: alpha/beta fold hydrolase [Lachnospiraceae bacterium]|jgi:glyoxylase-like metal-dependent hydrolase (beta-lactamase superfamily II)/esterase/lipase